MNRDLKRKMFLIFFAMLTWTLFANIDFLFNAIRVFLGAISPLIIGFIIAFILNKPMMFFHRKIFTSLKISEGKKKVFSLLLTIILFLLILLIIISVLIPGLVETGTELKHKFPAYLNTIKEYFSDNTDRYSKINQWVQALNPDQLKDSFNNVLQGSLYDWVGSTFSVASSVFGSIISFALGLVFSVYFLLQKDNLLVMNKRVLKAFLPEKIYQKVFYVGELNRKAFSDFILAQSLEALLLGSLFFVTLLVFRMPYATIISLVIAVFSFIPIVGAFAGLVTGIFLIFVESPKLAGLFIILFFVLQQIESNIIYPRLVGKISGISPLVTLAAVTLGGGLMGIIGIILFVPIFAVLQRLLFDFLESSDEGQKERAIP